MAGLNNCTIRFRLALLVGVFVFAFVAFTALVYQALNSIRAGGSISRTKAAATARVAALVPLTETVAEAYLTALQIAESVDRAERAPLIRKLRKLRADYRRQHSLWAETLPDGSPKEEFVASSYEPALLFFGAAEEELIPTVLSGERARARKLTRGVLRQKYEAHRAAIRAVLQRVEQTDPAEAGETEDRIRGIRTSLVAWGFGLLAVISPFGLMIAGRIARPLGQTAQALEAVAEGEPGEGLEIGSRDEVGRMAAAANKLMRRLSTTAEACERARRNEKHLAEALDASSRGAAESADGAAAVASALLEAAATASHAISRLDATGAEIARAVGVIGSLTEQTHLLALNATIEAARAGEAGRGFALLANEVKDLARETGRTSEALRHQVAVIRDGSRDAAAASVEIGALLHAIHTLQNEMVQIGEEQAALAAEIRRQVVETEDESAEIAAGAAAAKAAAEDAAGLAARIQEKARDVGRRSADFTPVVGPMHDAEAVRVPSESERDVQQASMGGDERRDHAGRHH
jgi:methyl-accepting chemotaxis protein